MNVKEFLEMHLEIAIERAHELPSGREKALLITKLDEASMWLDRVNA